MNNTNHKPLCCSTSPNEGDKQTFLAIRISACNVPPPSQHMLKKLLFAKKRFTGLNP